MDIDNDAILDGEGYCLSKKEEIMAIYIPDGGPIKLDVSSFDGRPLMGLWYNPRNGVATPIEMDSKSGLPLTFTPPEVDKDWAVVIKVKESE